MNRGVGMDARRLKERWTEMDRLLKDGWKLHEWMKQWRD